MSLSPSDTLALVQLRALLDQAKRATTSSAEAGRLIALVLLDAVNERVTHLAVQTLPGITVGAKDKFIELYSKVASALGPSWNSSKNGWAEVRKLHQARNSAQHEGISGDPVSFPGWLAATERYTYSLVSATFSVDLNEVFFANAIRDSDSSRYLREAEACLLAGDANSSIRKTQEAFGPVLQAWIRFHSQAIGGSRPSTGFNDLDNIFMQAHNTNAAQAFATDPGEYAWYSELGKGDPGHISADEARRALTFVFWWLVRWETLKDSLVTSWERRDRWLTAELEKKARKSDTPARISGILVTPMRSKPNTYRVHFEVIDILQDRAERLEWSVAVGQGLDDLRSRLEIWCSRDVVHNITMEISESHMPADLVGEVRIILENAEHAWRQSHAETQARLVENEDEDRRLALDFAEKRDGIPDWVTNISLRRETINGEPAVQIDLHVADQVQAHHKDIQDLIYGREEIQSAIWRRQALSIGPSMDINTLVLVLNEIDGELRVLMDAKQRDQEHNASQLNEIRASFARALSLGDFPGT